MRLIAFDIEASNLDADFGIVLCVGWKVVGSKTTSVYAINEYPSYRKRPTDDKALLKDTTKALGNADTWLTWYGSGFDIRYLNTRLLFHKLPPLPPVPHIDGWKIASQKLKLHSNRLASVQSFFGLKSSKTALHGPLWLSALVGPLVGDRTGMRYLVDHCRRDVQVLEEAYLRLRPLIDQHPSRPLIDGTDDGCPVCGGHALTKNGWRVTRTRKYQRYQCRNCGAWLRGARSIAGTDYFTIS